jgi:hypothetical protein
MTDKVPTKKGVTLRPDLIPELKRPWRARSIRQATQKSFPQTPSYLCKPLGCRAVDQLYRCTPRATWWRCVHETGSGGNINITVVGFSW